MSRRFSLLAVFVAAMLAFFCATAGATTQADKFPGVWRMVSVAAGKAGEH